MRIAVIDDLERDARQLADQVSTYMSTHRIPADTPEIFPGGEEFLAGFMPGVYDIIFLDIYMNASMAWKQPGRSVFGILPAILFS